MLKVTMTTLGPYELNEFGELIIGNMIKKHECALIKTLSSFQYVFLDMAICDSTMPKHGIHD
jgi:hypothetical protein